jgi:hypothetical protein
VLLAELLLDAVSKRGGVVSGVVSAGILDGASVGLVPFPEKRRKARSASGGDLRELEGLPLHDGIYNAFAIGSDWANAASFAGSRSG